MKPRSTSKRSKAIHTEGEELRVSVKSFGPKPDKVRALAQAVTKHSAVQKLLARTRFRLLRVDLLDPTSELKPARPQLPSRFRAIFFDYTNNRTVLATGRLAKPAALQVNQSALQPRPSQEEFDEAVGIVLKNPELGEALRGERLRPYRPMPP